MAKHNPIEQFFRLTPNVRDKLLECKLTAAEWRMWCYLVSLDPFGDRGAKFSPAELMLKCGIKKTAYFKAKAKFQQLGLFDFKDGVTKVINLQGQFSHSANPDYSQQDKLIDSANAESQSANAESQSANAESQSANAESQSANAESQSANAESQSANAEFKPPKPASDKDSGTPQTIQTYSDFIKTLSEGERERFFNFVRKQIKNFPKPINDLQAWLATPNKAGENRWEVYYQNFLKEQMPKKQHRPLREQIEERRRKITEQRRQKMIEEGEQNTSDTITDNKDLNGGQTQ
ncbi:hypothetical protein VB715_18720 [Crocosphaera sp. UHCC 0190]|uniref:hypothetical protein n=1 Tax=Crocosphaera sp. UHCC 0190 TaxID=3110246 RepID=UPI002B20A921|nr:hypothetical protein [Crocosphaera sp. UHCC 0190]MEA5511809.1 hypothetical protein [Crocosphaera sp. UHCC 0190]